MPRQSGSLVRQINGHEQRTADAPGWLSGLLGLTVPPTSHADDLIEQLIKQSSSTAAMHTADRRPTECEQKGRGRYRSGLLGGFRASTGPVPR